VDKTIGLVVKQDQRALERADALELWLREKGCSVVRKAGDPSQNNLEMQLSQKTAPAHLFCVLVLGGDGTFLSAVRWLGNQPIPILGVKFGEIGFLAETIEAHLFKAVEGVLDGRYHIRPRMRLDVEVWRGEEKVACESVLNDVVINKGALARLAHIKTYVDDEFLTDYRSDGLIVATPTGSTAYSLAAGGPIMHPDVPGILITPICPFALTNRPLIVPDSAQIKIRLFEKSSDIMLTFDGQVGMPIDEHHTILVRKALASVSLISLPDREYFDVLRTKLRWGAGRG
jgi:NAD+ kinase